MPDESDKTEFALGDEVALTVGASATPRCTLDELLAQCDAKEPLSKEDRAWIESPPAGSELL